MIRLYIDFPIVDGTNGDVVNWVIGWLYDNGYAFKAEKYKWDGKWEVEIYTRHLEPVSDIHEFVVGRFVDEFRYFVERFNVDVDAVGVCSGEECVDVQFDDWKRLEDEEHLEVEERWQRMVYGEDDDPEYREYEEAVRFERMVGLRNDGTMLDVVLEREGYE
jgi:hypothetical protein